MAKSINMRRRRVYSGGWLTSAGLRLKSHGVVHGMSELLLRPEIPLRRLNRHVAE